MATVNGYTAEHMQEIEDATIVSGEINPAGHLILTRHDGSTFDAGVTISSDNFATVTETFAGLEPEKAISPQSIAQLTIGAGLNSVIDLDTLVTPGQWHQGSQGNATLALHYPVAGAGGLLVVESQDTFVSQMYFPRDGYPSISAWGYQRVKFSTNPWSAWRPLAIETGYRLSQTVYFTTSGTFTKASYPGLKAVKVKVVGSGGAGGGAPVASTAGNHSMGGGGGGGGYAERFLIDTAMSTSISVTVGAGGAPASGANGGNGGGSSFGSLCVANGGLGGAAVANVAPMVAAIGGAPGQGFSGDFLASGSPGEMGTGNGSLGIGGMGGSSIMGGGGQGVYTGAGGGSTAGADAPAYGGGGGGAQGNSSAAIRSGGAGGPGVVIVEIYV